MRQTSWWLWPAVIGGIGGTGAVAAVFAGRTSTVPLVIFLAIAAMLLSGFSTIYTVDKSHFGGASAAVPRADGLALRVTQAQTSLSDISSLIARALHDTTAAVNALEEELQTRRVALDTLAAEAVAAEQQADQARALAAIEQTSAEAVDALLDRCLAERLAVFEKSGHGWDLRIMTWSLAAGLPVGILTGVVGTILVSH